MRLPSTRQQTRPAIPALMCTTVPPAKSSTPQSHISAPSPLQTMCAIGAYTRVNQMPMNTSIAENFMRSAKAPTISAGVMMAKVIWKVMNTASGNNAVAEVRFSGVTPLRNALEKPPTKELKLSTPFSIPVVSKAML
ncbi:hypothetical protein D3C79_809750 [compost metagenome]